MLCAVVDAIRNRIYLQLLANKILLELGSKEIVVILICTATEAGGGSFALALALAFSPIANSILGDAD